MINKVDLYVDGACKGNPGPGGWGCVIMQEDHIIQELYGAQNNTTNNRMELKSAIEGLRAIKEKSQVALYTDSQYVKNGINDWLRRWVSNGWKTANNKAVKNQDLWIALHRECQRHDISWHWVKGHSGLLGNERADQLAQLGCQSLL